MTIEQADQLQYIYNKINNLSIESNDKIKVTIKWYAMTNGITNLMYGGSGSTRTTVFYVYKNLLYSDLACTKNISNISLLDNFALSNSGIVKLGNGTLLDTGIIITQFLLESV